MIRLGSMGIELKIITTEIESTSTLTGWSGPSKRCWRTEGNRLNKSELTGYGGSELELCPNGI